MAILLKTTPRQLNTNFVGYQKKPTRPLGAVKTGESLFSEYKLLSHFHLSKAKQLFTYRRNL
jgi:hypothetical protein